MSARASAATSIAWATSVGVVLADSSIVTLALPDILRDYDTSVFGVSWVLTSFNLVLAGAILLFATEASTHPRRTWSVGIGVFAVSSLGCALSGSLGLLILARCVQAIGGAMIVAAAIELLARNRGSHPRAALAWGAAGTAGLAFGPAVGGVLTEVLSWQSIFLLQVPLPALLFASGAVGDPLTPQAEGRHSHSPELALGLISAGLTAALFLLVVLLTEGWGLTPIEAALVISVIPLSTLAASRVRLTDARRNTYAVAGTIAIAGGLAALGVLPGASADLAIAPQALVGAGLALTMPVLTAAALGDRDPQGLRGARTIAARHAGIVVGIVLLTPILSWQLTEQEQAGQAAGTSLLLDAPLAPTTKLAVADGLAAELSGANEELPDISAAFAGIEASDAEREPLSKLEAAIDDQLERAATHAFSLPFLGAATLAAFALWPIIGMANRREPVERNS